MYFIPHYIVSTNILANLWKSKARLVRDPNRPTGYACRNDAVRWPFFCPELDPWWRWHSHTAKSNDRERLTELLHTQQGLDLRHPHQQTVLAGIQIHSIAVFYVLFFRKKIQNSLSYLTTSLPLVWVCYGCGLLERWMAVTKGQSEGFPSGRGVAGVILGGNIHPW